MMRLGRPEHPAPIKEEAPGDQVSAIEDTATEETAPGRSRLLDRLKMLWSQKKEKHDDKQQC